MTTDGDKPQPSKAFTFGFFGCLGVGAAVMAILAVLIFIAISRPQSGVMPAAETDTGETRGKAAVDVDETPPKWTLQRSRSKIDDSETIIASLPASGSYSNSIGLSVHPSLNVQCYEHKFDVYVNADSYISGYEGIRTTVRVDGGTPRKERWNEARDHEGAFAPSPRKMAIIISTARQIVIRLEPEYQNGLLFTFDVHAAKETVAEVQRACGRASDDKSTLAATDSRNRSH